MKSDLEKVLSMLQLMDRYAALYEKERDLRHRWTATQSLAQSSPSVTKRTFRTQRLRRRPSAPRFNFKAKILLHKNDRYVKGQGVNVSSSGMFVSSGLEVFKPNEMVRIQIRPEGVSRSYSAIARVVRFSRDQRYPSGYGLQFIRPIT